MTTFSSRWQNKISIVFYPFQPYKCSYVLCTSVFKKGFVDLCRVLSRLKTTQQTKAINIINGKQTLPLPGEGEFEIPFMRDHLPNLERFYGCDMRQSAADALKHYMTQQLSARNIQVLFLLLDNTHQFSVLLSPSMCNNSTWTNVAQWLTILFPVSLLESICSVILWGLFWPFRKSGSGVRRGIHVLCSTCKSIIMIIVLLDNHDNI